MNIDDFGYKEFGLWLKRFQSPEQHQKVLKILLEEIRARWDYGSEARAEVMYVVDQVLDASHRPPPPKISS